MASLNSSSTEKDLWTDSGVFRFFNFTQAVIKHFTIDTSLTRLEEKEKKALLGTELVAGTCKTCGWESKKKHDVASVAYKEAMATKMNDRKRRRSADSSYLPTNKKAKEAGRPQETIDVALVLNTISRKKEKIENAKKLEPEHQARVDMRIFQDVVGSCLPLSTVLNSLFRNVCTGINPKVNVVCTKTLKKTILQQYLEYKASLRKRFSNAVDVCLTADAWGSKRRSFLGVTAHWLESKGEMSELKRSSAALACKRFQGSHTYDKIATLLNNIMDDFNLHGKVENKVENGLTLDEDDDPEFIEGLAALADLEDEEELEELREAATFHTATYRIMKDVGFSTIILPKHIRFGKLFEDLNGIGGSSMAWYLMAALTHPCFKAHWIKDRRSQEDAKLKLRQLIQDATYSPVLEKSKTSLAEEFLVFDDIHPSERPDDEPSSTNFNYKKE
ncbi:hypothetical protein GHT06_020401 [Daphnia sinensis]|uniref:DUF659 domain-containing protein n=1 Tax=Daphnia sinensis TaxID=1820382 RepID=A0AAD5KYV5_9CRUS|nr:hypothetical protein GHT06_020401 [Daphnia sinensis]